MIRGQTYSSTGLITMQKSIYHFHTSFQKEKKVYKCHIALQSVLRNTLTRNRGSISLLYREYIIEKLPPFLINAFQPFLEMIDYIDI